MAISAKTGQCSLYHETAALEATGVDELRGPKGRPVTFLRTVSAPFDHGGGLFDDDSCTQDRCNPTVGCTNTIDPGFAGADCELARLFASDLCAPDVLDVNLPYAIQKRVVKARKLLAKSAGMTKSKQLRKTLKKIDQHLQIVLKKGSRAATLAAPCRTALGDVVAGVRRYVKNLWP